MADLPNYIYWTSLTKYTLSELRLHLEILEDPTAFRNKKEEILRKAPESIYRRICRVREEIKRREAILNGAPDPEAEEDRPIGNGDYVGG